MIEIDGAWYIFYHRQTNRSSYARQACAERLNRRPDGGFYQAELTSCGLNGGPLAGKGRYPARIACNLWGKDGTGRYDIRFPKKVFAGHPYFTQRGKDRESHSNQYIANMRDGAVAGFKYFSIEDASRLDILVGGKASGRVLVSDAPDFARIASVIPAALSGKQEYFHGVFRMGPGVHPLYFRFEGKGSLDFLSFRLL